MKQQSPSSSLCCTNNLLLLPISGAFVILLGALLIILHLVTRGLTTSLYLVEGAIPSYVSAIVLVFSGILTALLYLRPVQPLIFVAFILSICCIAVCLVQVVTTAAISLPFLGSFTACVYKPSTLECQCYIFSSKRNNSFIADDTSNHHTFKGASTCPSIQNTLKDFLYIICIVYGFALIACLLTAALSLLLWCQHEPPALEVDDSEGSPRLGHGTTLSGTSASGSTPPNQPSSWHHEGTLEGSREQESRDAPRPATRGNPQRRTRSSSINSSQASPARRVTRHHSFDTADISPPDRPQRNRSRPPPVLTKGGYLQSQFDGPTIPVYTLQGTNEAYISLTDLPSLQLPSLESVPAFIPELPEPDEDPPPYSPVANSHPSHDSDATVGHPSGQDTDRTEIIGAMVLSAGEGDHVEQNEGDSAFMNEGACSDPAYGGNCTGSQQTAHARNCPPDGNHAFADSVGVIIPHQETIGQIQPGDTLDPSGREDFLLGENPRHDEHDGSEEETTPASLGQFQDTVENPLKPAGGGITLGDGTSMIPSPGQDQCQNQFRPLNQVESCDNSVDKRTRRDGKVKSDVKSEGDDSKDLTEENSRCNITMEGTGKHQTPNSMVKGRSKKRIDGRREEPKRKVPTTPVDRIRNRKQRIEEQVLLANKSRGHVGGEVENTSPQERTKLAAGNRHPRATTENVGVSDSQSGARPKAVGKRGIHSSLGHSRHKNSPPPSLQSLSEAVTLLGVRGHGAVKAGAGERNSPRDPHGRMSPFHEHGRVQDTKM